MTFTGRRLDDETGLFYYRNRYYHAQLGRFVTRDPTGYGGSQWNLYEYVGGRPVARVDPTGLDFIDEGIVFCHRGNVGSDLMLCWPAGCKGVEAGFYRISHPCILFKIFGCEQFKRIMQRTRPPVSYTHLTLPTN